MRPTQEEINEIVERFSNMRRSLKASVECQFIDMAQGGDGSAAMEGEIRRTYYPTWATEDFQTVCKALGWDYEEGYE